MRPSTSRIRRAVLDLRPACYHDPQPLAELRMLPIGTGVAPEGAPPPTESDERWQPVAVGSRWGGRDLTAWLSARAEIPEDWQRLLGERWRVALRLILGYPQRDAFGWPEGLLYVNERLLQGINSYHPDVLLPQETVNAREMRLNVRAWSGLLDTDHRIEAADLALLDRDCEALTHLLDAGADVIDALHDDDPLLYALASALEGTLDGLDVRDSEGGSFRQNISEGLARLRAALTDLRLQHARPDRPRITAVGHGHLDVAWLWQTRHTREKTARTFSVATALMNQYPEYVFLHTTPQVYAWLQRDYPELFGRVAKRVRDGHFEAAGAMWLESDCNLVSGESLVRQIVYGQRFLRETFGAEYEYPVLWLPDAFGYSAALPQILLKSGLSTFVTTKMSWSETNRMPVDTFRWRGLDGSEVMAHFLTTPSLNPTPPLDKIDTYNGLLTVPAVLGAWQRYRQKDANRELLLAYGYGDGGAGPTRQMLDQAHVLAELPGLPEVRLGRADEYFAQLHQRLRDLSSLPAWDGELYLEYHRGTYTTQGWLKRAHRRAEGRLLLAEMLDAWLPAANQDDRDARKATLDEAWRTLLLHEFHDILPGSSISPVYADARTSFATLDETLTASIDDRLRELHMPDTGTEGHPSLLVFNSSPFPQTAVVQVPEGVAGDAAATAGGQVIEVPEIPAWGFRVVSSEDVVRGQSGDLEPARAAANTLENGFFRLELDENGEIRSCVDKRVPGGREVFRAGQPGNALLAFDDRPRDFDAWDIDATYERTVYYPERAEIAIEETGPVRATLRVRRRLRSSTIEQRISVYRSVPRIDIATEIDWHEQHLLLKAAFPFDLRATHARYEIQYGSIERPTHRNTSWDQARFEVVGHRWADISEGGYGVSLLNDGKYGHDANGATLRLSLLRSPTWPDPTADQGRHEFTYSLLPHLGDWRDGGTVQQAYALNRPMLVRSLAGMAGGGDTATWLFAAEPEGVVLEAIKRADDGDGVIVRVYDAYGTRQQARVRSSKPLRAVEECDLLERPLRDGDSPAYAAWLASPVASHDAPEWDEQGWSFTLRPFEVRTFRVQM